MESMESSGQKSMDVYGDIVRIYEKPRNFCRLQHSIPSVIGITVYS
jgi:hypothetical protein